MCLSKDCCFRNVAPQSSTAHRYLTEGSPHSEDEESSDSHSGSISVDLDMFTNTRLFYGTVGIVQSPEVALYFI